jgi:KipI family sensor histidine kinase inhibitor
MGERGLLVEYGDEISYEANNRVLQAHYALKEAPPEGLLEMVMAYRSLLLIYDPLITDLQTLESHVTRLSLGDVCSGHPPKGHEIPVCYGKDFGPDLDSVAGHNGIRPDEVIKLHCSVTYRVFMMGFTPGFAYMGIVDPRIRAPRLKTPRLSVPEGSVGIAEAQTGIYPTSSPGGWRIIGRTPIKVFDPSKVDPFLFAPGDLVTFRPISLEEFHALQARQ